MADSKSQIAHVESLPEAASPEHAQHAQHHVSEIDPDNQAAILRVGDDTGEKRAFRHLPTGQGSSCMMWKRVLFPPLQLINFMVQRAI